MTDHLGKWFKVQGLLGEMVHNAWVTATEWGEIAQEIADLERVGTVTAKPLPATFKALKMGNLTLRNSGTDDQGWVNALNTEELGPIDAAKFALRRDTLISSKILPPVLDVKTGTPNLEP